MSNEILGYKGLVSENDRLSRMETRRIDLASRIGGSLATETDLGRLTKKGRLIGLLGERAGRLRERREALEPVIAAKKEEAIRRLREIRTLENTWSEPLGRYLLEPGTLQRWEESLGLKLEDEEKEQEKRDVLALGETIVPEVSGYTARVLETLAEGEIIPIEDLINRLGQRVTKNTRMKVSNAIRDLNMGVLAPLPLQIRNLSVKPRGRDAIYQLQRIEQPEERVKQETGPIGQERELRRGMTVINVGGRPLEVGRAVAKVYELWELNGPMSQIEFATLLFDNANANSVRYVQHALSVLNRIFTDADIAYRFKPLGSQTPKTPYDLRGLGEPEQLLVENGTLLDENLESAAIESEMFTLNEAAVIANIILLNKAEIESSGRRINDAELQVLKDVQDLYAPPEEPMSDAEIIAFRNSVLEKLEIIYDSGLENQLYETAREEIKDFIILILDLDPTYLKDLVHKRREFVVHTDASLRVVDQETHVYLPHGGREPTEEERREVKLRRSREKNAAQPPATIALRPPSYAPSVPEAQPAPVEMSERPPAEEISSLMPVPTPEATLHIEEAQAIEKLAPSQPRREGLEDKYRQVISRDPEAIKSINEIIGYIISEMPELWEDPHSTITPGSLTRIINNVTASFINDAVEKHTIKPKGGAKRARTELRLWEAAGLAYLKSTQAKNWDSRTKQKALDLVRELVDKAIGSVEEKRAKGQLRAERYSRPTTV